jgi:hypothetical protein
MKIIRGLKDAIKETNQLFKLKALIKEWKKLKRKDSNQMSKEEMIKLDNITGQIRTIVHYNNPKLKALILQHNAKRSMPFKK